MAYFGVTASGAGLEAAEPGEELEAGLRRRLGRGQGPVVVLVHGFRLRQGGPEAHRSLFALGPGDGGGDGGGGALGWAEGLGFRDDDGESGLCVGFAWPASAPIFASLLTGGRNGLACVYERAAGYGARLAELMALLQRLAPGRPVDLLAHSLGARVALAALPGLAEAPGRVILLGAAEFGARAVELVRAAPGRPGTCPEIYNVTARANDLYDLAFEIFAPRRGRGERALGLGLGVRLPGWLDLQLDRPEVTAWVNGRGIPLSASTARLCHWGVYTRGGALAVYEAILRRRPGWDVASLRAQPCLMGQEPRWSRLVPRSRLATPAFALARTAGAWSCPVADPADLW